MRIRKILRKLSEKSTSSSAKWSLAFGYAFSTLARILAYFRYLIISYFLGASEELDVFWFVYSLGSLAPGILLNSLRVGGIPVLKEIAEENKPEASRILMARINRIVSLGCIILSLLYIFLLPFIFDKLTPGFSLHQKKLIPLYLILLIPYFCFTVLYGSSEIWAIFNGKYALLERSLFLSNLFLIIPFIVCMFAFPSARWVPIFFNITAIMIFLLMVRSLKPFPFFEKGEIHGLRKIFKLSLSSIILTGAGMIYKATDKTFASLLPTGGVTIISMAILTNRALTGSINAIYDKIALAKLSEDAVKKNFSEIRRKLYLVTSLSGFYLIPVATFLWFASPTLISILFKHGMYTETSTLRTIHAFRGYLPGIPIIYLGGFLRNYLIATQKPFRLIPISYSLTGLNALLDWLFIHPFQEFGITIATSCVQTIGALILILMTYKEISFSLERVVSNYFKGILISLPIVALGLLISSEIIKCLILPPILILTWIFASKNNLFPDLPEEWKPETFIRLGIKVFRKEGQQ